MTSSDLAIRANTGLAEKIEYATELAKSELLPRQYRDKPANILLVMEFGDYLGLPPVAALRLIHVIDSKPVASAELIAGRVRSAGHRLRVSYNPGKRTAVCSIWRTDDPQFEFRAEWSWERANAVRDNDGQPLTSKMNWRNYYPSMLKWRATTECARDACPEILLGVSYTPDELGAQVLDDTEAGEIGVMTQAQRVEHNELRRMGEPPPGAVEKLTEADPGDPWTSPAETASNQGPEQEVPRPPSKTATEHLAHLLKQVPLGDEADTAAFITWATGHPASQPLTAADAKTLTTMLDDALATAEGDGTEAASQLWQQHARATRATRATKDTKDTGSGDG